ncbi:LOW QUALITY PROTEIN: 1-acyl dihydroxyacetone phosphate reductase [Microdochium trichocladiopsis]|uniref:1-acyl dihydroxyacetone phosphate reductase n=1 Tax=Microdochium trichocladiopsis TaxID=1682393 RepID=A0A9P9BFQ5_9PEZI|nr:LOW QUALITY PROTEIN: 1-acyl dihydroxyacetone phosphate reductase [Microdochium trichocladiopsis]KAH7012531.1 LOW QUALITY PROTEIN: 1-acyl dihydroxyacetone phosphate reductase [Microdochium trichocladiopsis]
MPAHSDTKTVAVVTGCSSGIGQGLAEVLAARGLTVLATARKVKSLAHLTKKHDNIIALPLELGDLDSLTSFRDARTGGRVDVLINNAGTHYAATAADLEIAEAEKLFTINVFAVMRLCQLFLPMLRESAKEGRGGRIVQIGSVTRDVPVVWQSVYNASKAALSQYTNTLRLEVKPFGVSVTEVITGYVQSNILHHGLVDTERMTYEGNRTGMPSRLYAESVVDKILRPEPSSEIWEGKLAWVLGFLVNFCPSWFSRWVFYRSFKLDKLKALRP